MSENEETTEETPVEPEAVEETPVEVEEPAAEEPVAEELAAEAAAFVRRRRAEVFAAAPGRESGRESVRAKSTPTDPVTIVDTETERLLRERLGQLRPGDGVLGEEEGGPAAAPAGSVRWVVDPIDGTVNFLYGIPVYAVSVAAQVDGVSVAGAVADVARGEIFSAAIGLGAHVQLGGERRRLHCSAVQDLPMALLGTGFSYEPTRRAFQAALLAQVLPRVRDVRRLGSAALDLCMVAAGRLDAYYEHGLNEWDWAAGALIAAEAGAVVALPGPSESRGLLVAAAPGVASSLTAALESAGAVVDLGHQG